MITILPKLTKDYILSIVSQEEIMEYYTKIPINDFSLSGNSFCSPLRKDKTPTCNYYYSEENNKLRLRDWAGQKRTIKYDSDIFDVVGILNKINSRNKQGFNLILNIIAKDFKLHKYCDNKERLKFNNDLIILKNNLKKIPIFKIIKRNWNKYDKQYWYDRYYISSKLLEEYYIYPINELYIEGKDGYFNLSYKYTIDNPAYAIYGGRINGIVKWKIYFPIRKTSQPKFKTNYSFLQGIHQLQLDEFGIITKSIKDVLCLRNFKIQSFAVASENNIPTFKELFLPKQYFNVLVSLFDYDKTGIRTANILNKEHNIPYLFPFKDYKIKDFSDFVETFGMEKAFLLIKEEKNKYKEDLLNLNSYNINKLQWIKN